MKIEAGMNLNALQERMGSEATQQDAERMRELLVENGYEGMDTAEVGGGIWEQMLSQAAAE